MILIEVPDEIGGYGAKGVGEIGLRGYRPVRWLAALHSYDGIRRIQLADGRCAGGTGFDSEVAAEGNCCSRGEIAALEQESRSLAPRHHPGREGRAALGMTTP